MHSHKCVNPGCPGKINGVPVIWHHSNEMRGNVEAHKCPVCGFAQWEQHEHKSQPLPGEIVNCYPGYRRVGGTDLAPTLVPVRFKKSAVEIAVDVVYWGLVVSVVVLAGFHIYKAYRKGYFKLPEVSA